MVTKQPDRKSEQKNINEYKVSKMRSQPTELKAIQPEVSAIINEIQSALWKAKVDKKGIY